MEREYTPRLLTPYCAEQLVRMAKSLGIGEDLYHLLLGADYVLAHYRMVGDDVRFYKGDMRSLAAELICDDLINHLSSCKSPHMMEGAIIKTYYA